MNRNGIYLYGYYGQGNLGDDLLMASAVRMIRAVRPEATIFVHCHDPARLPDLGDRQIVPVAASAELAQTGVSKAIRLARYFRLLRATFRSCDTLVFGGGTVFQDSGSATSLLIISATVMLARRTGLAVITIGAGVGALKTRAGKYALRSILRNTDLLCVRDEASQIVCKSLVQDARTRLTADLVYALGPAAFDAQVRKGVAISIQPAVTRRNDDTARRSRDALRAVISAAVGRAEPCLLLAFETKLAEHNGLDDAAAWRDTASDLIDANPGLVRLEVLSGSVSDGLGVLRSVRVHYGMRYHGHVLAALAGTPFAGLAHDIKVREVCRTFGMPFQNVEAANPDQAVLDMQKAGTSPVDGHVLRRLVDDSRLNVEALREIWGAMR